MPKRAAEQYDNDGGFVEDAPKGKKSKRQPAQPNLEKQKDGEGNPFWQISGKRRVVVSEYKGSHMVSIREYYEKDGEMRPGGKGVTMTLEQYNAVVQLLPQIEGALKERGVEGVERPDYGISDGKMRIKREDEERDEEKEAVESGADEEDSGPLPPSKKTKSKLDKFKHSAKKNHEATSDEED